MKKFLIMLTVVAMASFLMTGCFLAPQTIPVTGVTLDEATLALVAGGATGTLVETVLPADATDPSVAWASSDEVVATVALGVVTPLTAGTADITVTTVDGSFIATCEVTVVTAAPAVVAKLDHIVVLPETMALFEGDDPEAIESVTAHYDDETTADIALTDCTYASSDTEVATVSKGVVTVVAEGTTTISVSYAENEVTKIVFIEETDTVEVTVSAVELDHIVVLPETMTLDVGDSETIESITAYYNNGDEVEIDLDDSDCDYTSDDEDVAEVVAGEISALTPGTATITVAYTEDWTYFTDTVVVTVPTPPVHNITTDKYYTTIEDALDVDAAYDTIEVAAGTYKPTDTLLINVEGLTLRSIDGAATTIIATAIFTTFTSADTPCIQISAPNVTVEGFTMKNIDGKYFDGIWIGLDDDTLDASYATVTGNKIDTGIILCFTGGDYSDILNNTIVVDGGINLEGTLTLTSVTISGNDISNGNINMNSGDTYSNILITENTISGSKGIYAGIDIRGALTNFRVTHNDITDNPGGGIQIYSGTTLDANSIIRYNNIEGNSGFGLKDDATATVNAILNWWGDKTGPSGNVGTGLGDAVIGLETVDEFDPWSTSQN